MNYRTLKVWNLSIFAVIFFFLNLSIQSIIDNNIYDEYEDDMVLIFFCILRNSTGNSTYITDGIYIV